MIDLGESKGVLWLAFCSVTKTGFRIVFGKKMRQRYLCRSAEAI